MNSKKDCKELNSVGKRINCQRQLKKTLVYGIETTEALEAHRGRNAKINFIFGVKDLVQLVDLHVAADQYPRPKEKFMTIYRYSE
jgi:hypothetical protein